MTVKHELGTQKINADDWKVRCGFPWMLVNWICFCFSLFLYNRSWNLIVVDLSIKIEEFLHEMAIVLKNGRVKKNNRFPLLTDLIERSVLIICDEFRTFYLLICISLSLFHRSTAPFCRPSASLDFLHSFTPRHYPYCSSLRSVQNTTPEGVLSSCGCHERSEQSRSSQEYIA